MKASKQSVYPIFSCFQSASKLQNVYLILFIKQVSILNLCFSSTDQMEDWKYGSREDNEHSVSCSLPVFHPASKPKIYFLILLSISGFIVFLLHSIVKSWCFFELGAIELGAISNLNSCFSKVRILLSLPSSSEKKQSTLSV